MTGRKRKEARKTSTHLRTFKFAVKKLTRVVYKILMPKTLRLHSWAQSLSAISGRAFLFGCVESLLSKAGKQKRPTTRKGFG